MRRILFTLLTVFIFIVLLLTLPYAWKVIAIIIHPQHVSFLKQLTIFQWVAVGIIGFSILHALVKRNMSWLETFSHEFTHTVVALLMFRRIHSFHAEEGTGEVWTSGHTQYSLAPMALAPYCLPTFTYLLLSIRCLMDFHGVWIYDILIGATIAFHYYCFKSQTGNYQPDIKEYPLYFSYAYIWTARLINFCIIWVAFFPQYNVYTSFWRYLKAIWSNLCELISAFTGLF